MLSESELAIATDSNIILTKLAIMNKAAMLFKEQMPFIDKEFATIVNEYFIKIAAPKVTKGENYKSLPYIIFDYPAIFSKKNIFALRTMFWWGNFISITLHVCGEYKRHFEKTIIKNLVQNNEDIFICINENQWQHNFDNNNYILFSALSQEQKESISQKDFIKIALIYKLHHWNMMQQLLPCGYKKIREVLKA